jgi:5-methylcytosine-specific restriction protein A
VARKRKEWVGKNDDANAPKTVRLRNFDDHGGICHLCKIPIKTGETWETDHVIDIIKGGPNRESNLAPAHKTCHAIKTAETVKERAKVDATRASYIGIKNAPKMQTRPMQTTPERAEKKKRAAEKIQPAGVPGIFRRIAR